MLATMMHDTCMYISYITDSLFTLLLLILMQVRLVTD